MHPFNEKTYQFLKYAAMVALPALAALVGSIGDAVNWDGAASAMKVIIAASVFVGAMVGTSTSIYNKTKEEENKKAE